MDNIDSTKQRSSSGELSMSSVPVDTTKTLDPSIDVVQLSHVGQKRKINEDCVGSHVPSTAEAMERKGVFCVVADGMGGHDAGEVASKTAVETASKEYFLHPSANPAEGLRSAIEAANAAINEISAKANSAAGMGTTLIATVLKGNRLHLANVGDSRGYVVREGCIEQISEDHSWVQEQIRAGKLSAEDLYTHPRRNLITRALGLYPDVEIDLFQREVRENDVLVLCSDGLWGQVTDDEIAAAVTKHSSEQAAKLLVDAANDRGGPDNITVVILRVPKVPSPKNADMSTQRIANALPVMKPSAARVDRDWWFRVAGLTLLLVAFIVAAFFLLK
jgi:serine/threonine protein phosphatase PrpC